MLTRRAVCLGLVAFSLPARVSAQLRPFRIRVTRNRSGLGDVLLLTDCIPGELYLVAEFDGSVGEKLCDTLELPYRFNANQVSSIPTGTYAGRVRISDNLGWHIELTGTGPRTLILIHTGNRPSDIEGCILVGRRNATKRCELVGGTSVPARNEIRARYGGNNGRPIEVKIDEG